MSTITTERPVLEGRPSAEAKLPGVHAELLALLAGHFSMTKEALPWALLLRYVDTVAFDGPSDLILDDSVQNRNPDRLIAELLGDLSDYGLVEVRRDGLLVTSAGNQALTDSVQGDVVATMTRWLESARGRVSDVSPPQ